MIKQLLYKFKKRFNLMYLQIFLRQKILTKHQFFKKKKKKKIF